MTLFDIVWFAEVLGWTIGIRCVRWTWPILLITIGVVWVPKVPNHANPWIAIGIGALWLLIEFLFTWREMSYDRPFTEVICDNLFADQRGI